MDVQLILSASNNQRLTSWAQEAYYDELLRCGVRIALYEPQFLHAKHMSVDEDIAVLGSINMDIRSFALNAEIGLICYDRAFSEVWLANRHMGADAILVIVSNPLDVMT